MDYTKWVRIKLLMDIYITNVHYSTTRDIYLKWWTYYKFDCKLCIIVFVGCLSRFQFPCTEDPQIASRLIHGLQGHMLITTHIQLPMTLNSRLTRLLKETQSYQIRKWNLYVVNEVIIMISGHVMASHGVLVVTAISGLVLWLTLEVTASHSVELPSLSSSVTQKSPLHTV